MKKTLFAGPWVGEFGWELFGWQGRIRRIAKQFDTVVVASRPGHQVLYEDFCDTFVNYSPGTLSTSEHFARGFKYNGVHKKYVKRPRDRFIGPNQRLVTYRPQQELHPSFKKQDFVKLGTRGAQPHFDLVVHARGRTDWETGIRNWPKPKWQELIARAKREGLTVVTIGHPLQAKGFEEAADYRGKSLRIVTDLLANASMIAGPSSGPLHLASLCGCPQVVWSPIHNKVRYEKHWNPFETDVSFILAEDWQATVDDVLKAVLKMKERGHAVS